MILYKYIYTVYINFLSILIMLKLLAFNNLINFYLILPIIIMFLIIYYFNYYDFTIFNMHLLLNI